MLSIPTRHELRRRPIIASRVFLSPLDTADARELFSVVDGCRAYLEPWLPWVPFQPDVHGSARFIEASSADWDALYAMRLAIRDRNDGRMLGVVSLDTISPLNLCCDLGYWLRRDVNGKGLMTEAASTIVEWGFRFVGLHRIRVAAATDNHRSLAVIQRLGFKFEGIARHAELVAGRWLDHAIFARLATDEPTQTRHGVG